MAKRSRSPNLGTYWYCNHCKFETVHRAASYPDHSRPSEITWIRGVRVYQVDQKCRTCGLGDPYFNSSNAASLQLVTMSRRDFEKIVDQRDAFEKQLRELKESVSKAIEVLSK